jgi:hypothetical protein
VLSGAHRYLELMHVLLYNDISMHASAHACVSMPMFILQYILKGVLPDRCLFAFMHACICVRSLSLCVCVCVCVCVRVHMYVYMYVCFASVFERYIHAIFVFLRNFRASMYSCMYACYMHASMFNVCAQLAQECAPACLCTA